MNKLLVQKILENADSIDGWTLHGFGMLRLYLSKEVRLHVWDSEYAAHKVSTIHTHPWDFKSTVIAGLIYNQRFNCVVASTAVTQPVGSKKFSSALIKCGEGGGIVDNPDQVYLSRQRATAHVEGQSYEEKAEEIHESMPFDGTVTLVERSFKSDTEHARVFWPDGTDWVTAEPKKAQGWEVRAICEKALNKWFR